MAFWRKLELPWWSVVFVEVSDSVLVNLYT